MVVTSLIQSLPAKQVCKMVSAELSDEDLKRLVEKLSGDVKEREAKIQGLRLEVERIQAQLGTHQQVRADFSKQFFKVEEVTPLMEQCLQVRETLEQKKRDTRGIAEGTASNCKEVKVLERKLCDLESESVLKEMEACNKENMASVEELKRVHQLELNEQETLREKLAQLQDRVCERRKDRGPPPRPLPRPLISQDTKLDKFIRKTCQEVGLDLYSDHTRTKNS